MSLRSIRATLRMGAFVASFVKRDRAIGDFQAERCSDGSVDERNLAAVGAHEFVGDHEAEPGASGPRRSLERLEQVRPCLIREARTGVRNLNDRDSPLAPPGDPDLIARGVIGGAAFQRLHGIAREVDKNAQQLIAVCVGSQAMLDGRDPPDPGIRRQSERIAHIIDEFHQRDQPAVGGGSCARP